MAIRDNYVAAVLADSPYLLWEMQDASGELQDTSGNSRPSTAHAGTPDYQQAGPMGDYSVHMTSNEFFSTNGAYALPQTDNWTLEIWMYRVSDLVATYVWENGLAAGQGFSIFIDSTNHLVGLANNVALLTAGSIIPINTWKHVVIKRASTIWTYYINGVIDLANAGTTSPGSPSPYVIAGPIVNGTGGELNLAYGAIYDHPLSDARVAAHFAASQPVAVSTPISKVTSSGARW